MSATLVLYTFCVRPNNPQLDFFLRHGIFEDNSGKTRFILICNHPTFRPTNVPSFKNVTYLNRENRGFDFAAWSYALAEFPDWDTYSYFVFVNDSVMGPFLPPYCRGLLRWTDVFVRGCQQLSNELRGALFGSTINNLPTKHVQSYAFCMSQDLLFDLVCDGIFESCSLATKKEVIVQKEIRMSTLALEKGYAIGCLIPGYQAIRQKLPDVAFRHRFFGESLSPYDVIFIKCTRDYRQDWLKTYVKSMDQFLVPVP